LRTNATHKLELFKQLILLALFLFFDLLLGEMAFLLLLLLGEDLLQGETLLCLGAGDLLLHQVHVLFTGKYLAHFLFHLFLDLLEDAFTFLALTGGLLHQLECLTESLSEADEVAGNLGLLIECDRLCLVIDNCLHEAFTVTLIEEVFHLGKVGVGRVKGEETLQRGHLQVAEVVPALLKDPD
jgi:hypothetical protein